MKDLPSEVVTYRQSRAGVFCRGLLWITAKNRDTGDPESIGLWQGDDHQIFSINSVGRTYYGAGTLLDMPDINAEVGIQVRQHQVTISPLAVETQQAVLGYNARLAPVEVHRAEFDTTTGNLISEPIRLIKGWIDNINFDTPGGGGDSTCVLTIVSSGRALTKTLGQKFSDASQRLRDPDDEFYQYVDISGNTDVWWGEKRGSA